MERNDAVERSTMKTFGIINALDSSKHQSITNVAKPVATTPAVSTTPVKSKYIVTECYNIVRNMFVQPEITEMAITARAWRKLMCFIHLVGEFEITGFGRIQRDIEVAGKVYPFVVTDFDIIEQEVKSAYVEADADAVLDFMRKLPADQRNEWTLDWHSHVNMGVTPSGTDWTNYSSMLTARMQKQFPAMIVNKSGNVSMHQIITAAKHPEIRVLIETSTDLTEEEFSAIYYECKEKVENLCTKATVYQTTTTVWNGGSNYQGTANGYYGDYKRWWEEEDDYYGDGDVYTSPKSQGSLLNPKKEEVDEDPEVVAAKQAGFVFDDGADICPECGLPVAEDDHDFKIWGICRDCLDDYQSQGLVDIDERGSVITA